MSTLLSVIVMLCTSVVLLGCYLLLRYCRTNHSEVQEGQSMGHSFDGIEELNNPLPKWWSVMFILTIVFAIGYLILFPGFGRYAGLLNWHSSNQQIVTLAESEQAAIVAKEEQPKALVQYDREIARADAHYGPIFAAFAERPIGDLARDPDALKIGQRLFLQNCALCHSSDARGSQGFPNLTDGSWLYGGSESAIKASILHGRNGMMPPKGGLPIENHEIPALVEYVRSLSGAPHDKLMASEGIISYQKGCFACHGMAGEGNPSLGAPALNDTAWLYGSSRADISHSIEYGRSGNMPAWDNILGHNKVHLISAYVVSLSQGKQPIIRKNIVAVQPRPGNVTVTSTSEDDAEQLAELASASIETLAVDQKATEIGRKLFAANCTVCHGQNGKGMANFPDLTDKEWIYGNSPSDIKATIMHGRNGALGSMPAWDNVLGEDKVQLVSAYVYSLSQL